MYVAKARSKPRSFGDVDAIEAFARMEPISRSVFTYTYSRGKRVAVRVSTVPSARSSPLRFASVAAQLGSYFEHLAIAETTRGRGVAPSLQCVVRWLLKTQWRISKGDWRRQLQSVTVRHARRSWPTTSPRFTRGPTMRSSSYCSENGYGRLKAASLVATA